MGITNRVTQLILAAVFGLVVSTSSSAFAVETTAVLQGDLMSVLRVTLANQSDIEIGKLDIESASGDVQAAGGRFDSTVFGNAYYEKNDSLLTDYEKTLFGYDAVKSESAGVEVGVRRMFRSGYEGEAAIRSIRVDDQSGLEGYPTTTRNVLEFSLIIPLSRGGSLAVTAEERQFQLAREAARQRHQKIVSDAVAATVSAYWDYLEAYQNQEIKKKIEERTVDFLKNTNRLIELGDRPAADSTQISAQLASKRGERIEAERGLYEAKQNLGIAMGIHVAQLEALGDPSDPFPILSEADCSLLPGMEELFEQARNNRGDYQASRLDEEAVGVEIEKDMDDLKPRLDLKLSANIEGVSEDSSFLDPTVEEASGPGGMILLNGEWPVSNNRARGALISNQAQQRQARLRTLELERNIRSNIAVAAMDVRRIANAAVSINEAVELYNTAVAEEVSRLRLGLSTLTNVITVEDKRNSAQEDLITQQSALAKAIVRLRNETGTLLRVDDGRGMLDRESIISIPVVKP
jgi:outer membrane protein